MTKDEEKRILGVFALLDKSGDGKLSVEELDAFTRATNASCVQDRQVTLDSSRELLKQIDADHDGQVTAKEWSAHPGCRPQPSEHTRARGKGRGMQSFPCPTTSNVASRRPPSPLQMLAPALPLAPRTRSLCVLGRVFAARVERSPWR